MKNLNMLKSSKYVILSLFVIAVGCADLAVENKNSPTTEEVYSSASDLETLVQSAYVSWWQGTTDLYLLAFRVGGDIYTSSWGNFDMLNRGTEPRIPYDNSATASGDSKGMTENLWYAMYGVLADADDYLVNIQQFGVVPSGEDGVSDEDYTKMVTAAAYFLQGLTFADIGLYYDKGFIFDETTTDQELLSLEFSSYQELLAAADAKFKKAADLAASLPGNVTFGDGYISGYDDMVMNTEFVQLMNSFRARTMVLGARTPDENQATDWAKVKQLTAAGIQSDFSPMGDDNFWYNYNYLYANQPLWIRVDQTLVHLLDPSQPSRYPVDGGDPGQATSVDDRLLSDFIYSGAIGFSPSRGYYFFSHYVSGRYGYHTFSLATGAMPRILKAENDLMWAEAVVRTSDAANYAMAAQKVNNTRVTRGGLTPLTAAEFTAGTAMDAIYYERMVELFNAGFMRAYGDKRRFGKLQTGSLTMYPVPAKELNILQKELYTFGGVGSAGDVGTSADMFNPFKDLYPVQSINELRIPDKQ